MMCVFASLLGGEDIVYALQTDVRRFKSQRRQDHLSSYVMKSVYIVGFHSEQKVLLIMCWFKHRIIGLFIVKGLISY